MQKAHLAGVVGGDVGEAGRDQLTVVWEARAGTYRFRSNFNGKSSGAVNRERHDGIYVFKRSLVSC